MILVKHADVLQSPDKYTYEQNVAVFGGFSKKMWVDEGVPSGDIDSNVFALLPKFRVFPVVKERTVNRGICYMNTQLSDQRRGLGFGRNTNGKYRVWIDEKITTGSYVSIEDPYFESGYLVDSSIRDLNIEDIEIWGLGDDNTLRSQQNFKLREPIAFEERNPMPDYVLPNFGTSETNNVYLQASGIDRNTYGGEAMKLNFSGEDFGKRRSVSPSTNAYKVTGKSKNLNLQLNEVLNS